MADPRYEHVGSVFVRIAEEAAEVGKAALKCERFGVGNHHPERPEESNGEALEREMADLIKRFEEWVSDA